MASSGIRDLSDYPRPWFYRPEVYYGFIIFPPVWSVLTLRSPWHSGEGFRGILAGGIAWFFIIAMVVLSVRWVQEGGSVNLFIFVPGLLLTLVTQIQWAAHRARYGPPPTESEESQETPASATGVTASQTENAAPLDEDNAEDGESADQPGSRAGYPARRRRRRRRRPISRSANSAPLC